MGGNREGLKGATNLAKAVRRAQGLAHGLFHGFDLIGGSGSQKGIGFGGGLTREVGFGLPGGFVDGTGVGYRRPPPRS